MQPAATDVGHVVIYGGELLSIYHLQTGMKCSMLNHRHRPLKPVIDMEWMSIKPTYQNGYMRETAEQAVFSLLTRAGFQLEQLRRNVSPALTEYFYFHPGLHIQVHEVSESSQSLSRFFIFYPGGSTAYAEGYDQLRRCFAAG